ncbi:unnamed protein product [Auanema sp. JU1783]|nr:unnamed protein product [Auanema sp. JU1783]
MPESNKWITPGILRKFQPYRRVFLLIAVVSIFFSVLIIVENIIFFAVNTHQHLLILLLPYLLSWLLVILGCLFARIAYILYKSRIKQFTAVRAHSPTAWTVDSRPVSPSIASPATESALSLSYNSVLLRQSLTLPSSPFFISDGLFRYQDEPPSYEDVVQMRASPQPPRSTTPVA